MSKPEQNLDITSLDLSLHILTRRRIYQNSLRNKTKACNRMTARDAYSANETIQQKFPDHQIINLNTCAELETLVRNQYSFQCGHG